MKIDNKFLRFVICYVLEVGAFAILLLLLHPLTDSDFMFCILKSLVIALLPTTAVSTLLLREGLDNIELWARRFLNAIFSITCINLTFMAFGIFSNTSKLIFAFCLGLLVNIIVCVPVFIIIDRRNKRKLEEINKGLKKHNQNS